MKINTLLFLLLLVLSSTCQGQEKKKVFKDSLDGAFDISNYMYNLHGLLPVAMPITEPAVGFGAALAAVYFIPKEKDTTQKFQLPDIVAIAGGLTENQTWFAGGGYFGFWKKDHIRYRGVIGYGDINLKYYGNGNEIINNNPIKFALNSFFFFQQATFRIKGSRFMLGGNYTFSKTKTIIFKDSDLPWLQPKDFSVQNSGIGILAEYETLDNFLSPNKGWRINLSYTQFLEFLGGDRDLGKTSGFIHYYLPIVKSKWMSGFRIESQMATGDVPFYMNPFINLRGIPAMRYQGALTALVETEQLFRITNRWGIVGFAGMGTTFNSLQEMKSTSTAWNYGTGFRYLLARQLGLRMGIDVAKGPLDDWGIYIIFGTAWTK